MCQHSSMTISEARQGKARHGCCYRTVSIQHGKGEGNGCNVDMLLNPKQETVIQQSELELVQCNLIELLGMAPGYNIQVLKLRIWTGCMDGGMGQLTGLAPSVSAPDSCATGPGY